MILDGLAVADFCIDGVNIEINTNKIVILLY